MSLQYICIEVRKNLRCANVFLQFDQSLTETEFLKINVDEDVIRLQEYSTATRVNVAEYFTIEARTISNLIVEECNASFRLTIDNIKTAVDEVSSTKQACISQPPQIEEGDDISSSLHCGTCKCDLLDGGAKTFKRVREFPSGSVDMTTFFCHPHCNGDDELQNMLIPQSGDVFYGFQFVVLNRQLLESSVREKESHIYCRRCLEYLGETLFNGKAAKLWADTLLLKNSENDNGYYDDSPQSYINIFKQQVPEVKTTTQLLHKIIHESALGVSEEPLLLQQMHFTKTLLETTFPNRRRSYLLLNVLEKELQVLRSAQPLAHGNHNNNNVLHVQLQPFKSFKLLYRLMQQNNEEEEEGVVVENADAAMATSTTKIRPLLAYWQQDITIHSMKISPTLFSTLLSELDTNSELLPELYRYTQDDFQLSYIFY